MVYFGSSEAKTQNIPQVYTTYIYSSGWLAEDTGAANEIFTGPYLPLPEITDGKVAYYGYNDN